MKKIPWNELQINQRVIDSRSPGDIIYVWRRVSFDEKQFHNETFGMSHLVHKDEYNEFYDGVEGEFWMPPEPEIMPRAFNGWMDPDGNIYGCSMQGHVNLAEKICKHNIQPKSPEAEKWETHSRRLERAGWIKLQAGFFINMKSASFDRPGRIPDPTDRQKRAILDYCNDLELKYPGWIEE